MIKKLLILLLVMVIGAGCGRSRNDDTPEPIPTLPPTPVVEQQSSTEATDEKASEENTAEDAEAQPAPPIDGASISTPDSTILPDRLSIPAIELDTPVVELGWSPQQDDAGRVFSEWDVADNAAGWHKNSALPW